MTAQRGLLVVGTLTILEQAHVKGWLDFEEALTKLRTTTSFRIDEPLAQAALAHVGSKRPQS